MLLRLPPFCSASGMFAEARTDSFGAVIRKRISSAMDRMRGSSNSLLCAISEDCEFGNVNKPCPTPRRWRTRIRAVTPRTQCSSLRLAPGRSAVTLVTRTRALGKNKFLLCSKQTRITMCYKGKCLFCIPVEKGCLVFAILSAIVTLLALLACVVVGLLAVGGIIFVSHEIEKRPDFDSPWKYQDRRAITRAEVVGGMAVSVVTLLASIPSLIAFTFSVLLCNGICKRRSGQVKAYFVYGVVITVITVIASIVQMLSNYDTYPGLMGLFGCVIYSLILWMVFETYTKLRSGAVYKDHIRLVEN
ncbi:uncharacterized protein [Choristoneura fumiferana]|uniref:uncharacterized protein n=1 Tax=Choristoneura fumiferana TaxID=7141 RepID=UPI003D15C5DD